MKKEHPRRRAIFLDRDGVINRTPIHRYVDSWEAFGFLPGVLKALRRLRRAQEIVVVVSNQSGVGRGILSSSRLRDITQKMCRKIQASGGKIHAVYYCTHPPENGCSCRKPRPGMLIKAAKRFSIDLTRSLVIGDQETDILLGRHAGCQTILVLTGRYTLRKVKNFSVTPDRIFKNLESAVSWVLQKK